MILKNLVLVQERVAEKPQSIQFISNSSFAGSNHKMIVNGLEVWLGGAVSDEKEATINAVLILKERFNIDFHVKDVKWQWGGQL